MPRNVCMYAQKWLVELEGPKQQKIARPVSYPASATHSGLQSQFSVVACRGLPRRTHERACLRCRGVLALERCGCQSRRQQQHPPAHNHLGGLHSIHLDAAAWRAMPRDWAWTPPPSAAAAVCTRGETRLACRIYHTWFENQHTEGMLIAGLNHLADLNGHARRGTKVSGPTADDLNAWRPQDSRPACMSMPHRWGCVTAQDQVMKR